MALRWKAYAPNTILKAVEVQDLADNGAIQVDTFTDLDSPDVVNANVAYILDEFALCTRIAAGVGKDKWRAPGPTATGGDEIVTVGNYHYHLFTKSGDFIVGKQGDFEVMVVGAGGAGGQAVNAYTSHGGGGGAGAIEPATWTATTFPVGTYPVVVGAGGGHTDWDHRGNPGGVSSIGTVTALGGGGGGCGNASSTHPADRQGGPGGSGGGGGAGAAGGAANGSRTHAGASGNAGGGGGAGGAGSGATGGAGIALTTLDPNLTAANFPVTFAGMTEICAGGKGGSSTTGAQPKASTYGSGGNGTHAGTPGNQRPGQGGDGLVIVRYPK